MRKLNPREGRTWPGYLLGGRVRTSTLVLIIAFLGIGWLYETYQPTATPEQVPASEVVPPGFIPDPNYTWAPRTDVLRKTPTTTTTTTTPTTTSTTPTTPSSPAESSEPPAPGPTPSSTPVLTTGSSPAPSPAPPAPESTASASSERPTAQTRTPAAPAGGAPSPEPATR